MDNNAIAKAAKAQTAPAANGGAVAKTNAAPPTPKVFISNLLAKQADAIKAALPAVMTPERFSRIALTAVNGNPKLQEACVKSPMTFLGALMTAAQLGLEPNTPLGQAYLIPYNNKKNVGGTWMKVPEVQFTLGYRGMLELAYRSVEVSNEYAEVVFEKDKFEYELGLDPKLKHIPEMGDRGKPIYVYAVVKTKSGQTMFQCKSYDEIIAHAKKYSKSYSKEKNTFSGPWQTEPLETCRKTTILAVLKYAPMKTDFVRAITTDTAVRSELSSDMLSVPREDEVIDADFGDQPTEVPAEEEEAE